MALFGNWYDGLQIAMGTQVREMTDFLKETKGEELRTSWIEFMPWFLRSQIFFSRRFSCELMVSKIVD